jgi:hypothetical protein
VESGKASLVFGVGFLFGRFLLPFEDACPILTLFFVEFVLPLGSRLFTVFAIVAAFVAA